MYHHRIWYFPVMNGIKKGGGGRGKYKFVKKGGTSSRGDVKRNGGLIHLSALC